MNHIEKKILGDMIHRMSYSSYLHRNKYENMTK
jgi:hypothetical protein